MALVKHPAITPEKLAANQANARQSLGPTSREGVERIREGRIIHGFYSKAPREAMRALGEDPVDFDRLLGTLVDLWEPQNEYEAGLVRRLARVMWRLDRSDRIQEGMAVYQMEELERQLERQDRKDAAQIKQKVAALERLLHSAEHIDFSPDVPEWNDFDQLYGKKFAGRSERILVRMLQLQRPEDVGRPEPGKSPGPAPLEGAEREPARADLRSLLRQEIEAENLGYRQRRDERVREGSIAFKDACMASSHPQASFNLRAEDSAFNQLRHLHEMLTRLKAQRNHSPDQAGNSQDEGKSHDVIENKGPVAEAVGEVPRSY